MGQGLKARLRGEELGGEGGKQVMLWPSLLACRPQRILSGHIPSTEGCTKIDAGQLSQHCPQLDADTNSLLLGQEDKSMHLLVAVCFWQELLAGAAALC